MSRQITQTLALALLSLLLAFFFWMVAIEAEDPTLTSTYGPSLPIEVRNLPDTVVAYGLPEMRARVTMRLPQSTWNKLRAEDIAVYIDLREALTGTVVMPVQVSLIHKPYQVIEVTPKTVTLRLEPLTEREVTVALKLSGAPAIGYRADPPVIAPLKARVSGPASYVALVDRVQTTINMQDHLSDIAGDFDLEAVDAAGGRVSEVKIVPPNVTVSVPIISLGYFRDVPVSVSLNGQPAAGYQLVNLNVEPQVVKIVGRPGVVQEVRYLQTEPLELEGVTASFTTSLILQMPEGISIIQPPTPNVTVSLNVEAIRSSLTLDLTPQIRGLGADLTATVQLQSVVVLISGPYSITESLDPASVQLILDLSGLPPGEYSIRPVIQAPAVLRIEKIIPELVPVNLKRAPLQRPVDTSPPPPVDYP